MAEELKWIVLIYPDGHTVKEQVREAYFEVEEIIETVVSKIDPGDVDLSSLMTPAERWIAAEYEADMAHQKVKLQHGTLRPELLEQEWKQQHGCIGKRLNTQETKRRPPRCRICGKRESSRTQITYDEEGAICENCSSNYNTTKNHNDSAQSFAILNSESVYDGGD